MKSKETPSQTVKRPQRRSATCYPPAFSDKNIKRLNAVAPGKNSTVSPLHESKMIDSAAFPPKLRKLLLNAVLKYPALQ